MSITDGKADGPFNSMNQEQEDEYHELKTKEAVEYFNRKDTLEDTLDKIDFMIEDLDHIKSSLQVLLNKVTSYQEDLLPKIKESIEEHMKNGVSAEELPELEILDKLYKEFPQLLIPDQKSGSFIFTLTGLPLVKEDYEIIREYFLIGKNDLTASGKIKFYGIEKVGNGNFTLNYIYNSKGIPKKAQQNLPPLENNNAPVSLPYFHHAKVGDEVSCRYWGNGVIYDINFNRTYPLIVEFNDGEKGHLEDYLMNGKSKNHENENQRLFYRAYPIGDAESGHQHDPMG